MEPEFIPGLELSRQFYEQVVGPLLDEHFSRIPYSAGLIGAGSEVLGFDTERSTDHDWGPGVMLFLNEKDHTRHAEAIRETLQNNLPGTFRGYPLNPAARTRDSRGFEVLTLRGYILNTLGFDLETPIEPADWLTFPEQTLLSLTQGAVYRDEVGLEQVRRRFEYYPQEVWLYLLAAGWTRIGQEEHLMGRAGQVGDEIGSSLIAARLVRDVMRLWFLMEKQYAPYPKWFGTAFSKLAGATDLLPVFQNVLRAETWSGRQEYLAQAYEMAATKHNTLKITEPMPEKRSYFFDRPFLVIGGKQFADAIFARITEPALKKLTGDGLIGSVDQFSDSTDLVSRTHWRETLKQLYK